MPFAFWNLMSAARVAPPKLVVSLPLEPGPDAATIKPLAFSHTCRAFTSAPVEPTSRLRAKVALAIGTPASELTVASREGETVPPRAFNCAMRESN